MSDISFEDYLIFEGFDYKETSGAKGAQLNIRACPKCGKEKWKVYVGVDAGAGNCFSCGKTFNLWSFVGCVLESRGGAPTSRDIGQYLDVVRGKLGYRPKDRAKAEIAVAVTEEIELPMSGELPYECGWVHPYLLTRGINGHYAKLFHLRYSPTGSWRYQNDKGETVRQSFADRILIPVYDLHGELVTFQGRDVTGESDTRYKFAGGLPGTGRYLFNGHTAHAKRSTHALMVEGPLDVIGAQKAIDTDHELARIVPLGSFGMHLSKMKEGADQIQAFQRLKRVGLQTVTIMWDPEPKAYAAALDAAEMLLAIGLQVNVALLPAGCDPGDADAHVICEAIRQAKPVNRLSMLRLRMQKPF